MKIPKELLIFLTNEEANILAKFYGTDLYAPYLKKLKEKYSKLLYFLDDEE